MNSCLGRDLVVQEALAVVEVAQPVRILFDGFFSVVGGPEQPLTMPQLDHLPQRPGTERFVAGKLDGFHLDAGAFVNDVQEAAFRHLLPVQRHLDRHVADFAVDFRDRHPPALGQERVQVVAQLEPQPLAQHVGLELVVALELDGLDDLGFARRGRDDRGAAGRGLGLPNVSSCVWGPLGAGPQRSAGPLPFRPPRPARPPRPSRPATPRGQKLHPASATSHCSTWVPQRNVPRWGAPSLIPHHSKRDCLLLDLRQILKARALLPERQLDGARGTIALLGDDDLRRVVRLVAVFPTMIVILAVQQHHHVRVLFDRARLSRRSLMRGRWSSRPSGRRFNWLSTTTGTSSSRASDLRYREIVVISCWRDSMLLGIDVHQLEIIHDEAANAVGALEPPGLGRSSRGVRADVSSM